MNKKATLEVSQDLKDMKRSKSKSRGSKRSSKSGRKSDKPDWGSLFPTFSNTATKNDRRSANN